MSSPLIQIRLARSQTEISRNSTTLSGGRSLSLNPQRFSARQQNLYGYPTHKNAFSVQTAGIHISFTEPVTHSLKDESFEYNRIFDFPLLFRKLDEHFNKEIKESKDVQVRCSTKGER